MRVLVALTVAAALCWWLRRRRRPYKRHRSTGLWLPDDDPDPDLLSPAERTLDTTGCIGRIVWPAAEVLCDFLQDEREWVASMPCAIELGAGMGVPGMLAARLGLPRVALSDYHPLVLNSLREAVSINALASSCTVVELSWLEADAAAAASTYALALGADLTWTTRGALDLARAVRRVLGWREGCAADGIFLYAHVERKAVYMGSDGTVQRDDHDTALRALCEDLCRGPIESHLLWHRQVAGDGTDEGDADGKETVLLLAFGSADALDALLRQTSSRIG